MKLETANFELDLSKPKVMGILNVTPDSFSDGGKFNNIKQAIKHCEKMINQGVDIIDIGGESTRPNAKKITIEQELQRVIPVIKEIKNNFKICISVDTSKLEVMHQSLDLGVDIINDVTGFNDKSLKLIARYNPAICIMHMQGTPKDMQNSPIYNNLLTEIKDFLEQRAKQAEKLGISKNRIILDPGFGFGKTAKHNMNLIKNISEFTENYPVLMGISRKSTLGEILGDDNLPRENASLTAGIVSILNGCSIIRVHKVQPMVEAIKVLQAIKN